jgi:nucleoside 2-deoxyribosyltransferase
MIKVYIAGAYSDDNVIGVLKNIGRGEEIAAQVFKLGFAPFTPWHDKSFVMLNWRDEFTVKQFYDYSIAWLKVSDAVLVVPNIKNVKNWEDSSGTRYELEQARELQIPIFYSIYALRKHYNN